MEQEDVENKKEEKEEIKQEVGETTDRKAKDGDKAIIARQKERVNSCKFLVRKSLAVASIYTAQQQLRLRTPKFSLIHIFAKCE